jgi:lysine 6-dehydrogenase
MSYRYAIIGSGRQGTAAAYDLGRFGQAAFLLMVDQDRAQADRAAQRLNALLGNAIAEAAWADAGDPHTIAGLLRQHRINAFLSAVPYFFNLGLTHAAMEAGCGMTDLGGNTEIVYQQLEMTLDAAAANISVVPDCGQVPGMGTSLVVYAIEQLDEAQDVFMWDGGLPVTPRPPWNYILTFHVEGLTNEYYGEARFIRRGRTVGVPVLEELEAVDFPPPIGRLEAFTTAGGLSTAARTFAGKLRTLQNKTLRYPGHYAQLKVMHDLGLFDLEPIQVDNAGVIPRHVLHALWEPQIVAAAQTRDLFIIRVLAQGQKDGRRQDATVELIHYRDEATGFTAMEQGTGWHASILTAAIVAGRVPKGVIPVEQAMTGTAFVAEARKRGFDVRLDVRPRSDG